MVQRPKGKMNSPAASPDRGSTLVLIDDVGSSSTEQRSITSPGTGPATAQSSTSSSLRTGMPHSSTHPPDPLLYGLQTMEWRPWLRPSPGSSSTVDEYAKSPTANDEYSNYASKTTKPSHYAREDDHAPLDMHGVGPCRRSLYWWGKTFWTLLLLAAAAGLAYEVYKTVNEFWWSSSRSGSYSIAQASPDSSIPFPDIYVCPTNPINETYRRRRRTDMKWFQILSAMNQKSNPDGILGKLLVNWDYFSQASTVVAGPPPSANGSGPASPTLDQQVNPVLTLDDLPPVDPAPSPSNIDSMREYFMRNGYEMDAFLVECAFRSKSFKCSELAQATLDRKHGKCFLLPFSSGNAAWPHSLSALATSNGALVNASWRVSNGAQGVSLAMNIHTELYPKENGSLYDGVYLYVDWRNDPGTTAFTKPILLPPGTYSSVSLESRDIKVHKWSPDCYQDELEDGHRERHSWQVLNSPRYYRQDLCKFDCILQSIIDICHCLLLIDGRYVNRSALVLERRVGNDSDPFSFTSTTWSAIGYCTSEQLAECAFDILQQHEAPVANEFNNGNCTRSCRPSCRRREFRVVSNSFLKLPAESYLGSGPNYPFPWNELKNNYVIVDIVLEKGQTTVIDEGPSMNLEVFLGILGGQMSLFLGCSLLTIVQVLVLFLSCCTTLCQRVYQGKCLTLRKTLRKMRHSSLLK